MYVFRALVGLFPGMQSPLVMYQMAVMREALMTFVAFVRLHASVNAVVQLRAVRSGKLFSVVDALVPFAHDGACRLAESLVTSAAMERVGK